MGEFNSQRKVILFPDSAPLAHRAAQEFVNVAVNAVAKHGSFTIALAGGSTPKILYSLLVDDPAFRSKLPWDKIHLFFGDDRHAGPDDKDSNYRMAYEAMLSKVAIPANHIYRIAAEKEAQQAADEYEATLRTAFQLSEDTLPRFDLVLLGMGPDGHTASLFPGTSAVHESKRLVAAPWVEKFNTFRITLTPPVLCNAAYVVFAAGGVDKTETLQHVLQGPYQPDLYPSQVIRPTHGTLLWLVDKAAARLLS